jgi:hypothetical protein
VLLKTQTGHVTGNQQKRKKVAAAPMAVTTVAVRKPNFTYDGLEIFYTITQVARHAKHVCNRF